MLAGGVERGGGEQSAETSAGGTAELAKAERGDGAILAVKRNGVGDGGDGRHFEKAGQSLFAQASGVAANWFGLVETGLLEQRLRELERDGRAAERLFRIRAARLIGIEDGEGSGECIMGGFSTHGRRPVRGGPGWQMMIGDDEVESEAARGFSFSDGAHARVDSDDDTHAFGMS